MLALLAQAASSDAWQDGWQLAATMPSAISEDSPEPTGLAEIRNTEGDLLVNSDSRALKNSHQQKGRQWHLPNPAASSTPLRNS